MPGAGFIPLLPGKGIGGAVEEVRRIYALLRISPVPVVIHLFTAVGAVYKPGQGIRHTEGINALRRLPQLLGKLPGLPVHDGLMSVLEDQPVLLRIGDAGLVLIGFLMGPEVDGIAHILRLSQDVSDNIAAPVIGTRKILFVFPHPDAASGKVDGGCFHLIIEQHTGDLIRPIALNGQPEDPANDRRRFLVDDPLMPVIRVLLIPVDGAVGGSLAGFALNADRCFLFAAQITQIPLVHDIQERDEFVAGLIVGIYVVGDGDEVYPVLPEENFRVEAGL